jgi:hypothetical protein
MTQKKMSPDSSVGITTAYKNGLGTYLEVLIILHHGPQKSGPESLVGITTYRNGIGTCLEVLTILNHGPQKSGPG